MDQPVLCQSRPSWEQEFRIYMPAWCDTAREWDGGVWQLTPGMNWADKAPFPQIRCYGG